MMTLLSALTLAGKIGISIAVFAVLIVVEVVALLMLLKWKKNYKLNLIKKAKEELHEAELAEANAKPVTAIDVASDNTQVTPADTTGDTSEEKKDDEAKATEEEETTEEKSAEEKVEATEEKVEATEEKVDATEEKVEATEEKVDATEEKVETTEEKVEESEVQTDEVKDETQDQTVSEGKDESAQEEAPSEKSEEEQVDDGDGDKEEVYYLDDQEGKDDKKGGVEKLLAAAPFAALMSAVSGTAFGKGVLYTLIFVAFALAVAVFACAVIFSQHLKHGVDLDDLLPVKEAEINKPKEEKEEPKEEPKEEEKPEEEPKEEEKPEEAPVEEVAQEEAPAEQPVEEEVVAEETPAEEEAVADETPAEEVKPVEEEKPAEEVKPKPAPVKRVPKPKNREVVIDNVSYMMKDERFLFNPTDDGWYILLTKTFTAKLIQSEEYVKDYYTELKNELLSYTKVHARMSKKRESFNYGRVCLARMSIRGKTLRLHLALDANDYLETKFIVEDTSQVKSLADTPLMYRIKNDRRLKYAKELIAELMAKVGAVKQEIEPVDYTSMYPYEETEPLIERGLITRRLVQGKVPEDKGFDFAQKTFKAKLIQSDDAVKEYYSKVKNHLLSYKKVHDRMSKKRETYRFGRLCVARMAIRGKTLRLYLALNPADFVDTKYIVEDFSHVKSVADTPLAIKLKNPRRLKYALELIDMAMENVGVIKKREAVETDYTTDLAYESTEELMEKGLVTNVHVKGNSFIAEHFTFKDKEGEDEVASDEDK